MNPRTTAVRAGLQRGRIEFRQSVTTVSDALGWLWPSIIGLIVMFAYGGVLLGAMPVLGRCGGVSWQGHLCGAIAGVVAAYLLSAPERKGRTSRKAGTTVPRPKT